MNKFHLLSAAFFLFSFTKPAQSKSPGLDVIPSTLTTSITTERVVTHVENKETVVERAFDEFIENSFDEMDLRGKGLKLSVYRNAMIGYQNLKRSQKISPSKSILTIVDFSKPSRHKRLWVVDVKARKLLFHTYVAHGQGSGADMATVFSNNVNSHQSSLGFYVTSNTYMGKHGLSLKLHGMDPGFNSKALARAIVVHGADYVSKDFIKQQGRLGRSHGCPALPTELNAEIIKVIKDRTVLYIDAQVSSYSSHLLDKSGALMQFAAETKTNPATFQARI
ncbi:MAG: hypothetical protein JWQ14_550 [Adhaeribacter sp.]|nr:hypothetical protein [Adhaeribacter sp.]